MLIDGYVFLTQDQINMLALGAEPPSDLLWDHALNAVTGLPVIVVPEWPEKLEWGDWVIFSMEGAIYSFQPEVVKASLERSIIESGGLHLLPRYDYSLGLFQQRPFTDWLSGIV